MTENSHVRSILSAIKEIEENTYKKNGHYHLHHAQVLFDNLMMATSKVICVPYYNDMEPALMGKVDKAYQLFRWFIGKIKPKTGVFEIESLETLKHKADQLINIVNSLETEFDSPDVPFSMGLMKVKAKEVAKAFEAFENNTQDGRTGKARNSNEFKPKKMENLGRSYLLVLEPRDFDIKSGHVYYDEFGFVIGTQSQFFRDQMEKLCLECHKIRQRGMGSKIITSMRKRMKAYRQKGIKVERDLFELVALYFDLTYYTAISHDKEAHLRKFTTILGAKPMYFVYVGSENYTVMEFIEMIQQRDSKEGGPCDKASFINIMQLVN